MLILMTTANFPDVMLISYENNRFSCLIFIGYLLAGLYFLLNVLLAVVFDNYRKRILARADLKTAKRLLYVNMMLKRYD